MPCDIASRGLEKRTVLAVDADRPVIERVGAENRARGLGAPGADQAGEAENLAVMRLERNVDELDGVRIARVAAARQALDLERDLPMLADRALAIERADVAPDHHADDRVDIGVGDAAGADVMAVAQAPCSDRRGGRLPRADG